jgi:hypothetical protein
MQENKTYKKNVALNCRKYTLKYSVRAKQSLPGAEYLETI